MYPNIITYLDVLNYINLYWKFKIKDTYIEIYIKLNR